MTELTEAWRMSIAENLPCVLDADGRICDLICSVCGDVAPYAPEHNFFSGHTCGGDYTPRPKGPT
jgi:hypothetical protein